MLDDSRFDGYGTKNQEQTRDTNKGRDEKDSKTILRLSPESPDLLLRAAGLLTRSRY